MNLLRVTVLDSYKGFMFVCFFKSVVGFYIALPSNGEVDMPCRFYNELFFFKILSSF